MNTFKKYCPNVWVAECEEEFEKGEIIYLETKYGKEVECEVYNFLFEKNDKYYYSILRTEEKSYAERKAEKWSSAAAISTKKSNEYYEKSNEGKDFLVLGEPIKVGHHSEKWHRALIERNWDRMGKSVEYSNKAAEQAAKAEYWEKQKDKITLAMPESLEYFQFELEKAIAYHKGLKDGTVEKWHSYSLAYAKKDVNELKKKVEIAKLLWGETVPSTEDGE